MGDEYQLTWPPRRSGLLGDYHLHLDPQIAAEMRAIEARQNFERLRGIWLRPEWWQLEQISQPQWLQMRPTSAALVTEHEWASSPRSAAGQTTS